MKVLLTGDIHIGRRSSRIPESAGGSDHSTGRAWLRVVNAAVDRGVDMLLSAGDLVDRENRYFEAFGPLEEGLRRLNAAGIDTVFIAGNHDFDVLRQLQGALGAKRFHFLGASGNWESVRLTRGRESVDVVGWSFPSERYPDNPLAGFEHRRDDSVITIGLLHTDLDQTGSPYAPARSVDLGVAAVDLWCLGHRHKYSYDDNGSGPPLLMVGSPQAMDPGEPGRHGVWLADLSPGRRPVVEPLPLSTVRYEEPEVDLTGADDEEQVRARLAGAVRECLEATLDEGGPLSLVSCRLRLVGRTGFHHRLPDLAAAARPELDLPLGSARAVVERIDIHTRPVADETALARGTDAPAILARLLLDLEAGQADTALLRRARETVTRLHSAQAYSYSQIRSVPPGDDEIRDLLLRQGRLLLDSLLAGKGGS